jgi:hypothetical protein
MDTSRLGYVPYYDPAVYDNVDDRYLQWGALADWADVKIYTWVESDVPPEQWDALAAIEEGDTSIDQPNRKSGRAVKTILHDPLASGEWRVATETVEEFDVLFDVFAVGSPAITMFKPTAWADFASANIEVYVNGRHIPEVSTGSVSTVGWSKETVGVETVLAVYNLKQTDRVRVVEHVPGRNPNSSDEENAVVLEAALSGSPLVYQEEYQYSTDTYFDRFGIERSLYYFWVEDKVTRGTRTMSVDDAQDTLKNIPIPYVFYDDVQQTRTITYEDVTTTVPIHFSKAVLRGIRDIINDDDRYMIRWTRDMTLRDTLDTGATALEKKNLHEQWELIRREMPQHIPRTLWDRVTESIIGYKLTDPTVRVPSYQRELYDDENGTDTRYGLGSGQAFVRGDLALATILADLNNPDNDFKPVDINVFFQLHNFDTPEAIADAMNTIYNTFPYIHVNRMFFDVLLDALSTKRKYEDIFKTSMIAVHGIRPFQSGGIFDD